MRIETLKFLFGKDLAQLKKEIELYTDEKSLWVVDKNIANSGGNLCLHLIGNLNTFVGDALGQTGYIRNRELEFSLKNLSRVNLTEKIDATLLMVENTMNKLSETDLETIYPKIIIKEGNTNSEVLFYMFAHLSYHLGQINYHRRLLD